MWSIQTSAQFDELKSHTRFCCRKKGEPARTKPRQKHPLKVHTWAGISKRGATGMYTCVFESIMDRWLYEDVLNKTFVLYLLSILEIGIVFFEFTMIFHFLVLVVLSRCRLL